MGWHVWNWGERGGCWRCIREAISLYLSGHGDAAEACRQSQLLAQVEPTHWSEQLPVWSDWTA